MHALTHASHSACSPQRRRPPPRPLHIGRRQRCGVHSLEPTRLLTNGVIQRVARGQYRFADRPVTEHHALALAARAVPRGVICLLPALSFHGIDASVRGNATGSIGYTACSQLLPAHPPEMPDRTASASGSAHCSHARTPASIAWQAARIREHRRHSLCCAITGSAGRGPCGSLRSSAHATQRAGQMQPGTVSW